MNGTVAQGNGGAADAGAAESSTIITHLAPQNRLLNLENTVKLFPLALGLFEGQLGASFPFPSYHQVKEPSPRSACCCSQTLLEAIHG